MDKKYTTIGVLLLIAAVALMFWNAQKVSGQQPVPAAQTVQTAVPAQAVPVRPVAERQVQPDVPALEEKEFTLENDVVKLTVSSKDAALKTVELKKQPLSLDDKSPVVFNKGMGVPALQLAGFSRSGAGHPAPLGVDFAVTASSANELVLTGTKNGLEYTRVYRLSSNPDGSGAEDPYLVKNSLKIKRVSGVPAAFPLLISTGALPATEGDRANMFLNASWFADGDYEKCKIDVFKDSGGFLGFGAHPAAPYFTEQIDAKNGPLSYVAVTNQYFAGVLGFSGRSREAVSRVWAFPQRVPEDQKLHDVDLVAQMYAQVDVGAIPQGGAMNLEMAYFVGPKEYMRLADLEDTIEGIGDVVQFTSLFGFISIDWLCKILVWVMNGLHAILPDWGWSWGWAIVLMTLIVKGITWPLTMAQQRSAKKMQQVAEPMKAIREKYKDNPQKMQQETMKLYREQGINPLAGCLPIFIQIPIFFAMYCAFQTCAELRLQGFLWINDLTMPDTIPGLENFEIFGIGIHILPVLMGATMLVNMLLMPMTNAQPSQRNMFYAMAVFFPVIVYTMPSALTLYWTLQNCLTCVQTLIVRKQRLAANTPGGNANGGNPKKPQVDVIPPKRRGRGKNIPR